MRIWWCYLHALSPASNVVVSHWEVESSSTKELVIGLFENLKEGRSVADVLRLAWKQVRESTFQKNGTLLSRARPYFWAPFGHVGW